MVFGMEQISWKCCALSIIFTLALRACTCNAHYIQLEQNAFGVSGYQQLPLALPLERLPQPQPQAHQQRQPHLPASEVTPVEFMVDLTNDLTYRLLHYHSILNRNNFAFSPTALMSVLTVLYEGSAGRSAFELRTILQLPQDRGIIRIGYRDIQRRLRTYFFGSENPLRGLSLNRGNVTVTRDYETVLMFYGYDLVEDMVSSRRPSMTTTTSVINITEFTTKADANMSISKATVATTTEEIPTSQTIRINPPIAATATTKPTTEPPVTFEMPTLTEVTSTTQNVPETAIPPTNMPSLATSILTAPTPATLISTVAPTKPAIATSIIASSTIAIPTLEAIDNVNDITNPSNVGASEFISAFVAEESSTAEPFLRIQKAQVKRLRPSSRLQAPVARPKNTYLPSTLSRSSATKDGLRRAKRHLLEIGYKNFDTNQGYAALFHPLQYNGNIVPISEFDSDTLIAAALHDEHVAGMSPNFVNTLATPTSVDTGAPRQNYNTDLISHVFYLNNQLSVHTTFKVYNAVLYHKHFEQLQMSVLELELNTPEYNLVILLPDFHTDLTSAAALLRLGPTLRLMRKQLKPRWVQAIIPDFQLHGTVFLTNDLQNMGVCDIFEPNLADFRPMTDEKSVYVKHIEQSINVNIRTRPINQLKHNSRQQAQPIQISVNHPFLFFIIDRDLDVAVMAGRVLNPLNVRIQ